MAFKTVAIIGLGLIGSSVARAVREQMPDVTLIAVDSDATTLKAAQEQKLVDEVLAKAGEALGKADLVIYAVPVDALERTHAAVKPFLKKDAVVTDVASVKRAAIAVITGVTYVPAHPIAGSERRGVGAGRADLFHGKHVILTPADPKDPAVVEVAEFWTALGGTVAYMPAELHDQIYGAVSHLPQYLAFAVKRFYEAVKITPEATPAFARFMRLTHSDAALWSGIFNFNKDNINSFLNHFIKVLHQVRSELAEGEKQSAAPDAALVYGVLIPYLLASGLVSVVYGLEQEVHIALSQFVGGGFKDFTAPLEAEPEPVLEQVSQHSGEVARAIDHFISLLAADKLH